ncbi:MAG: hypothetical protein CMO20_06200 [Thermoplasmata archaeon]|nr:hypothetical protein [Thermoplasmata archaeon]
MARKKPKPFNPFAPGAAKKKMNRPTTGMKAEPKAVAYKAPAIPSKPAVIEPSKPKPAIPVSHLPTSEPKTKPEENDITQKEEVVDDVQEEKPKPSGPALASGKVRSVGLRKTPVEKDKKTVIKSDDDRVSDLIAESKSLAIDSGINDENELELTRVQKITTEQEISEVKKSASEQAHEKRRKMLAKKRKARAVAPPTKRVQKLNRRKYMEFKVDIREILEEENVPEEYRANLLGSTWAKGERQGIEDAITFINEKFDDGMISETVAQRIIKVLKGYRKVR